MPLDIGIGLILGVLLRSLTGFNYELCLALGVVAALLPDLDFIWMTIKIKRIPFTDHRDGLHYPLILVPIVGLVGLLFNPYVGLICALGVLSHFIHDSIGIGWGVKWLFPFKENSYLFLYQVKIETNKDLPQKKLYSWTNKERHEMIEKYADPDWIKHIYFEFHPFAVFEYLGLVVGIVIALLYR